MAPAFELTYFLWGGRAYFAIPMAICNEHRQMPAGGKALQEGDHLNISKKKIKIK